jgi:hypothetical protein
VPGGNRERLRPHYVRDAVRTKLEAHEYRLASDVRKHLAKKSWDESDVVECLSAMGGQDFHKSQEHEAIPDRWLDIYKPLFNGRRMYVKFMELDDGQIQVLSFCEDGEQHH